MKPACRAPAALAIVASSAALAQPTSVVNSPHNLSASGPGIVRAATEEQVCIFCHVPHRAAPIRPLWNRASPVEAYSIYASRALDAQPGQPTGTSKMCLSCHDGTIALGSVLSRDTPITMAGGVSTIPAGTYNIGTDLRDDHPISFRYDSGLSARDHHIKDPAILPRSIRLDAGSELQCTSCHDAHDDSNGAFLVMRNIQSELCISCHQVGTTTVSAHASCDACHQPHTAPSGPYLLRRRTVTETCLACHNGTIPGAASLSGESSKAFVHDTGSPVDPPGERETHTTCTDCHEPHTMMPGAGRAPAAHGNFGRVPGVSASGARVTAASYEYEVCFECHADRNALQPAIGRRIVQSNTRLEFSPSAVSFHPVESPGRNHMVPSLRPGWSTSSIIYCSSCHTSDTGKLAGGSGPDGTHGSNNAPLLAARYDTADFASESFQAYGLCYACHERGSILSDQSFKGHRMHIVDQRTPCAACHDAHGIASSQGTVMGNSNLINFASAIVFPDRVTGRLEFRDTGTYSGECFLSCHGHNHSPARYP